MASVFAWLDFSEKERRNALEVIDLFREEDTRDELGLGVIRDALSDLLFPGTSTIQTRARYFLFVAWLLKELEDNQVPSSDWARQSRHQQYKLRQSLMRGGEENGVIGYRAGLNVQRLPHSVYWQGLRRWGILRFRGSEEEYCRSLDRSYRRRGQSARTDDGEPVGDVCPPNWDPHLPSPPKGLFTSTRFDLKAAEADYIFHRIACAGDGDGDSLLHYLIEFGVPVDKGANFIWEHVKPDQLPDPLHAHVEHARIFSEFMHGAALLYNLMLAEEKGVSDWIDAYRQRIAQWWDMLRARDSALRSWDRHAFWQTVHNAGGKVSLPTFQFVEGWCDTVLGAAGIDKLIANRGTRDLIICRERQVKPSRARIGNPRALELWTGAAGTAQLDYRWGRPVKTLLNDILMPLMEVK